VGNLSDWELVSNVPLGRGGQSVVSLVRRRERAESRRNALRGLLGLGAPRGGEFAQAVLVARDIAEATRPDLPSELAALKKFIPRPDNPRSEEYVGRLKSEINVLKQGHPGFLKLLDSNEEEHWIVTEYCENGTLDKHLATYKGNVLRSLRAFVPLLKTVRDLHKMGIVHRDIKPQNIFIGTSEELLVGDFGIVYVPDLPERRTYTGESVGPRDFMPPWISIEDERPEITTQFDVYMLGKLLWSMVSGRMKLHREDFLRPKLDLTQLFPGDPHMYIVNAILEKCVVTEEKDCWDLGGVLSMVETFLGVVERGGQLLSKEVPRPCRVCGNGKYALQLTHPQKEDAATSFQFFRPIGQAGVAAGGFQALAYACDYCGNVQFFKTQPTGFIP
jgi:serine/threonine protein kinase